MYLPLKEENIMTYKGRMRLKRAALGFSTRQGNYQDRCKIIEKVIIQFQSQKTSCGFYKE
jgi:hypothetical protein